MDRSIRDNVAYGTSADDEAVLRACAHACFAPGDLSTRVRSLSGGEQMRVALARALYRPNDACTAPQLLIADELLAHLDSVTERRVLAS